MESKEVKIELSLEKAKAWFKSDIKELKDIAVKAYGNILENNYEAIVFNVENDRALKQQIVDIFSININILYDIILISTFYNGKDWKPNSKEECYFIYYNDYLDDFAVGVKPSNVYPITFIPYFKTREYCETSIKILKNKLLNYRTELINNKYL